MVSFCVCVIVCANVYLLLQTTFPEDDTAALITDTNLKDTEAKTDNSDSEAKTDQKDTKLKSTQKDTDEKNTETQHKRTVYKQHDLQVHIPSANPPETKTCDSECLKLRTVLETWDSSPRYAGKPKAAVYVLTSGRQSLSSMLTSLERFFLRNFSYPVVIFQETDLSFLRQQFPSLDMFFQTVSFEIPNFVNSSKVVFNIPCLSHISYRHMCRFQSKLVYEEPILFGLQFLWRLDDDSQILAPIQYDLFQFMKQRSLLYGYVIQHFDSYKCTTNLWPAVDKFVNENRVTPTFFHEWKEPQIIYNNFEISSSSIWRSESYQRYVNYLDRLGGIYYFRWGDAPIKSLALSLFVNKSSMHQFTDITYKHASLVAKGGTVKLHA